MLHLCTTKPGQKTLFQETAGKTVAPEFIEDWIAKNVYPLHVNNVAKKFCTDYQRFIKFRKQERSKSHNKLDEWYVEVNEFNDSMTKLSYDIRTKHVLPKETEATFWRDNDRRR